MKSFLQIFKETIEDSKDKFLKKNEIGLLSPEGKLYKESSKITHQSLLNMIEPKSYLENTISKGWSRMFINGIYFVVEYSDRKYEYDIKEIIFNTYKNSSGSYPKIVTASLSKGYASSGKQFLVRDFLQDGWLAEEINDHGEIDRTISS